MAIDTKHDHLRDLRIDRGQRTERLGEPPGWATLHSSDWCRLGGGAWHREPLLASGAPEVDVAKATAVSSDGGIVLSASGYIVAHHKISVNYKVTAG